jgi:DNA-binding response OmpR family regulator
VGKAPVDFGSLTVNYGASCENCPLTPKETELLKYFASHPDKVISRDTLLEAVWEIAPDSDITTRSVDTHVARLRQKLDRGDEISVIKTVHGAGYKFEPREPGNFSATTINPRGQSLKFER